MKVDTNDLLSAADYAVIMRQEGYFVGYYGSTTIDSLIDDIKEKLGGNLENAKGMSVVFYYGDDGLLMGIEQIMDKVESLVYEDTNVVINSEVDDEIPIGVLEYEILLSGLSSI